MAEEREQPEAIAVAKPLRIIGLMCERSVELSALLDESGALKDIPEVRVVSVPCSGMVKPEWAELAIRNGAWGAFICGCRIHDCHYREGNIWVRQRLLRAREPRLDRNIDPSRIGLLFFSAVEQEVFLNEVREFVSKVRALGPPAPAPAPRRARAGRAQSAGAEPQESAAATPEPEAAAS